MTSSEYESSADERFERLLIDSASSDELPSNVDAAWHEFNSALQGVGLLAAGAEAALAARRAQRWLAAKWLIWGLLTGSALTALSLRPNHRPRAEANPTLSAPSALPTLATAPPTSRPAGEAQPPAALTATATTAKAKLHSTRPHALAASSAAAKALSPPPSSTLAAQVALLDSARSAIASGAFAEALRLADRYRVDFPSGELSPEAEVVAIEALVAEHARQAASERAARFLARYPGDPHAARVKWLVR